MAKAQDHSGAETLVMEFFCKTCGKKKEADAEGWLLGFEGSAKPRVMKYTINLLWKWDEQRAREPNALCFCSAECQNKYVWKSYGDDTWAT